MDKSGKKIRVLLLNPPTSKPSNQIHLGLAYLAASLRREGHLVKIIDAAAPYRPVNPAEIKEIILDFKPHFIGVTLTITYIPQTYLYLKELRSMKIPIVAGGAHANNLPEEALENGADFVVIGEGEETIVELAEYFSGDKPITQIAGLCFKDKKGDFFYTRPRKLIENLDSIPFPDFGDFPIKNYTGSDDVNSNLLFWSIFSSRGCPFNCLFCSSHNVFGKSVRTRSAHNIFEEIKSLVDRFGAERITFQDDEILCSKKRFIKLCDIIINSSLKIKMSMRTRIDSINKEILLKMKAAGITRVSFGIESWNDDTLRRINKRYDLKRIKEGFSAIQDSKYPFISFNNIWGFPWETRGHFKKNLKEISEIPKAIAYYTTVDTPWPYPKTRLYEIYHKQSGFSDWWLNPKLNSPADDNKFKPFFTYFAMTIYTFHSYLKFWNYSKRTQNDITHFSWKLFSLFIRRHLTFIEYIKVISLCRISYFFWRISPKLENTVFRLFLNSKILDLREKLIFGTKY